MQLRLLKMKDAPLMLEWMHDKSVVEDLRTNFLNKTMEDCENFIKSSWDDYQNKNWAIVDENDTYMGTVSLKNIVGKSTEFGITVRSAAMGKGFAFEAMKEVIRIAFEDMELENVYWCVSPNNKRAVRFYDKNGFQRVSPDVIETIEDGYTEEQIQAYIWYQVNNDNKEVM